MPYYLYKVTVNEGLDLLKQLELQDVFDGFRDAKKRAKALRAEQPDDSYSYKIMFAENQLSAEEQLLEKREQPVLMEHER